MSKLPKFIIILNDILQVMYAFVMRPESLPKSYQDFIQKTGPVAAPIYKAVRDCCRGTPVDIASLSFYLSNRRVSASVKLEEFPSIIPCSMIHPDTNSCLAHNVYATSATFRKTFPLYFSLTFVPFVVLRLQKVDISLKLVVLFCTLFMSWFCKVGDMKLVVPFIFTLIFPYSDLCGACIGSCEKMGQRKLLIYNVKLSYDGLLMKLVVCFIP